MPPRIKGAAKILVSPRSIAAGVLKSGSRIRTSNNPLGTVPVTVQKIPAVLSKAYSFQIRFPMKTTTKRDIVPVNADIMEIGRRYFQMTAI